MADKEKPSRDQAHGGEQPVASPLPILLAFIALLGFAILYGVFVD